MIVKTTIQRVCIVLAACVLGIATNGHTLRRSFPKDPPAKSQVHDCCKIHAFKLDFLRVPFKTSKSAASSSCASSHTMTGASPGPMLIDLFNLTVLLSSIVISVALWSRPHKVRVGRDGLEVTLKGQTSPAMIYWNVLQEVKFETTHALLGRRKLIVFISKSGRTLVVPWRALLVSVQPYKLIGIIKSLAPHVVVPPDVCVPAGERQSLIKAGERKLRYTELWLASLATPIKRQRNGQLGSGSILCNRKYEVAGRIGGGGQGSAYLAVVSRELNSDDQNRPGQEVVLKEYILPVGSTKSTRVADKFHQEASILSGLHHPNIVELLDHFVEDHRGYLVMEYIVGMTLQERIRVEGPLPEGLVVQLGLQLCDIMSYLHSRSPQVVHRDITPDNLILGYDGQIKLIDFNVAHQLESTTTVTVVGKHAYIPPEQFRGHPTPQSDIYAVGATLFYLLTGEEPTPITTSIPRTHRQSVSEAVNRLVQKATAIDCRTRYATALEFRRDLLKLHIKKRIA